MNQVVTDGHLRKLLQTCRQARGLTQREAAERAGIDPSWWKKLESGRRTVTHAGTVAAMAYAVGIDPDVLAKTGWEDIADRLRILMTQDALPVLTSDDAEEHIARTPGTTVREREALIIRLRDIRSAQNGIKALLSRENDGRDPFDAEFLSEER